MPKAYWVVTYRSVKNPEAWKAYAKLAVPAIEGSGGRFLARSNPAKIYEAGMNERVVLVEFPSLEKALACHDTPAYKEALKALGTGNVERDMRVVEGAAWPLPLCERIALVGDRSLTLRVEKRLKKDIEQGKDVREAAERRQGLYT